MEQASYIGNIDALDSNRLVWPAPDMLNLYINDLPSKAGTYTFIITLRMSSGNTLTHRHIVNYQ